MTYSFSGKEKLLPETFLKNSAECTSWLWMEGRRRKEESAANELVNIQANLNTHRLGQTTEIMMTHLVGIKTKTKISGKNNKADEVMRARVKGKDMTSLC